MDTARKAKLGERWVCFSCGARFYDLNKPEPLCPKCGSNQHESPQFKKPKRAKKAATPKKVATPRPPAPIEDDYEADVPEDLAPDADADVPADEELDLDDLDMGEEEDLSAVEVVDED